MLFESDNTNLQIYKGNDGRLRYETLLEPFGYISEEEAIKLCKFLDSFYHIALFKPVNNFLEYQRLAMRTRGQYEN